MFKIQYSLSPNHFSLNLKRCLGHHLDCKIGIILVLFGAGKLPQVMNDIGKGIKNLKKGLNENEENNKKDSDK